MTTCVLAVAMAVVMHSGRWIERNLTIIDTDPIMAGTK